MTIVHYMWSVQFLHGETNNENVYIARQKVSKSKPSSGFLL